MKFTKENRACDTQPEKACFNGEGEQLNNGRANSFNVENSYTKRGGEVCDASNRAKSKTRGALSLTAGEIALVGLFVAIISVCAQICIPVSVPITLQTFAIMLALGLLSEKKAFFAIFAYLLLGAVGVPVFSAFRGGLGVLLSPTGGFLFGFLLMPVIHYLFCRARGKSRRSRVIALAFGIIVCFLVGTVWFCFTSNVGFVEGVTVCVLPFILPEALKLLLAVYLSEKIKHRLN